MKLHLRIDSSNKIHTRFTIFEKGINCGQVCMTSYGFAQFHQIVFHGCAPWDEMVSTGEFTNSELLKVEGRIKNYE